MITCLFLYIYSLPKGSIPKIFPSSDASGTIASLILLPSGEVMTSHASATGVTGPSTVPDLTGPSTVTDLTSHPPVIICLISFTSLFDWSVSHHWLKYPVDNLHAISITSFVILGFLCKPVFLGAFL